METRFVGRAGDEKDEIGMVRKFLKLETCCGEACMYYLFSETRLRCTGLTHERIT